jgi:hypothetical protein
LAVILARAMCRCEARYVYRRPKAENAASSCALQRDAIRVTRHGQRLQAA